MPDESCRKCGRVLEPYSQCFECKETIQRICVVCGERTLEQFHATCFYRIEKHQTELPLAIQR
jgi:hypothetical protein